MIGSGTIHVPASRRNLTQAMDAAKPHLRPIIEAVRDYHVGFLFVGQGDGVFRLPPDKGPAITIIGDDMDCAVGPDGFHLPSIRRAVRATRWLAVVSCAPPVKVYEAVATAVSATRSNGLIVETRPEQEIQWVNLIRKLAPNRPLCLATVKGGHA